MQFFNVTVVGNAVEVLGPYPTEEKRDAAGKDFIRRTKWEEVILKLDAIEKPVVKPYEFFDPLAVHLPAPTRPKVFNPDEP